MPDVEIRQIRGEALIRDFAPLDDYAFGASPPLRSDADRRKGLDAFTEKQVYMLYEANTPRASVALTPAPQTIRGQIMTVGAIDSVATHPLVRRKGYARRLMQHLFEVMRSQQIGLSMLYPFRESFYQKLGYAGFPKTHAVTFAPDSLVDLLHMDLPGETEMMLLRDGFPAFREYLLAIQPTVHGMLVLPEKIDSYQHSLHDKWLVLIREAGDICGMMTCRIDGFMTGTLHAGNFFYSSSTGKYGLLNWFARHIDQVQTIRLAIGPCEKPETWFTDIGVQYGSPTFDVTPMSRIVDIHALEGLPVKEGYFTAQIEDPLCPWNEGIFGFDSLDGKLHIADDDRADCTLSIQGLAALVYGTHDPADFALRGWGYPEPSIQAIMRTMFPPQQPYLYAIF